jgi:hypothetical protein
MELVTLDFGTWRIYVQEEQNRMGGKSYRRVGRARRVELTRCEYSPNSSILLPTCSHPLAVGAGGIGGREDG